MGTLRELFDHGDWANERLLEALDGLDGEALAAPWGPTRRTLGGTLAHVWVAERIWLDRWLGKPGPAVEDLPPGTPVAALRERLGETAAEREALFDRLGDDGFRRTIRFRTRAGDEHAYPLGDLAAHVYLHGIHHRAQALAGLRARGSRLPALDYLHYRLEHASVGQDPEAAERIRRSGLALGDGSEAPAALEPDTLAELYRHADWSRDRVMGLARGLAAADLDRDHGFGPGGTLRRTLLHVHDAEAWWLSLWTGTAGGGFVELPATTSMGELEERSRELSQRRDRFLAGLDAAGLGRPVGAPIGDGFEVRIRLGESALQLPGHGMHHRAQALDMLRSLAGARVDVDWLEWLDVRS